MAELEASSKDYSDVSVLLVDDNEDHRALMELILQPLGVVVVHASSGQEALDVLDGHEMALVIIDVMMPVMDGFETAEHIREKGGDVPTPIVFVTAKTINDEESRHGYSLGAVDYIPKSAVAEVLSSMTVVFADLFRFRKQKKAGGLVESTADDGGQTEWRTYEERVSAETETESDPVEANLKKQFIDLLSETISGDLEKRKTRVERSRGFAEWLGKHGFGAAKLVGMHVQLSAQFDEMFPGPQARRMRGRVRIVTLEVMGHLVEYYRAVAEGGRRARK